MSVARGSNALGTPMLAVCANRSRLSRFKSEMYIVNKCLQLYRVLLTRPSHRHTACPLSAGSASVTSFADTPLACAAVAHCAAPPLKQAVVGAGACECGRRTQRRRRTIFNGTQHRQPDAAARRPISAQSIDVDVHHGARLGRARSCLLGRDRPAFDPHAVSPSWLRRAFQTGPPPN